MVRYGLTAVAVLAAAGAVAVGQEMVGVPGSGTKYPAAIANFAAGLPKPADLTLTGTAMRKKVVFNVYALGSYAQAGTPAKTAAELAAADAPKVLHLVMERAVDGPDIAASFRTALTAGHPGEFAEEQSKLGTFLQGQTAKKGDNVWIIHVPGQGVRFVVADRGEAFVPGVAFAKAIWEIYLGPACIDPAIREGLTARLGK